MLQARLRTLSAEQKIVSSLAALEIRSAIRRRMRSGDLLEKDGESAVRALTYLLGQMTMYPLSNEVVERAVLLVDSHRLKTLDALQLATALTYAGDSGQLVTLVASDTFLLEAAREETLATWNPAAPQA